MHLCTTGLWYEAFLFTDKLIQIIMKLTDKESNCLQREIDHIIDSGANSIILLEMIDRFLERREVVNKNDLLPRVVCSTWVFFYEGEIDKPQFKVQANTQWEAYQIAEETYGPQVEDMIYCMI